jgi:hypothetical protein
MKTKLSYKNMAIMVIIGIFVISCGNPLTSINSSYNNENLTINIPVDDSSNVLYTGNNERLLIEIFFPHFKIYLIRVDNNKVKVVLTNVTATRSASVSYTR